MSLTDTEIRRAKKREKPYKLSDGGNLYLWITPSGGKLWRWAYRYKGKAKLMTFGRYPEIPLALARERHGAARKLLAAGVDPMAKRKGDRAASNAAEASSFQTIAQLWLGHWKQGKSARHADGTRRRLKANVYPLLGTPPITEIEAPELVAMVKAIETRGAADLAKRALETTGQIFRYAIAHGYAKRNPAADIKPRDVLKPTRTVNLARVDAKELPALLRAIEVYRGKVITRLAMKLMALTEQANRHHPCRRALIHWHPPRDGSGEPAAA
jgi:hypothetical protein